MKIDFYRHSLTPEDATAVAKVLGTPFLTTGKVCEVVEAQLREYFSVPHAILVNSWTNGALATLLAMGIGPGDEVIVPAMTFIASANVVELTGAKTVFADVDPETLLLMPDELAKHITSRTRAVIPVHLYGQMVDIPGMRRGARRPSECPSEYPYHRRLRPLLRRQARWPEARPCLRCRHLLLLCDQKRHLRGGRRHHSA